jgi:phospholipase C
MRNPFLGATLAGLFIVVLFTTACGGAGNTVRTEERAAAAALPEVTSFSADPGKITRGEAVSLSWAAANATSVTISPDIGNVSATGSIIISPKSTTTYAAVATDGSGAISSPSSTTITVAPASASSGLRMINHFIVMFQENRSFDSYFGTLNDYRKAQGMPQNLDGLSPDASNPGRENTTVFAYQLKTMCTENVDPSWALSHKQFNLHNPASDIGKMDGFVITAASTHFVDYKGIRAMGHYDASDLPFYAFMASQFATSNRWFSSVLSKSPPNRFYAFAATSAGYTTKPAQPLTVKTIFHLLEAAGISWKIYVTDPNVTYLTYFQPFGTQYAANIVPTTQFKTDAENGTLPAVAWIESGYQSGLDEHPTADVQKGAAYAASLIDTLMQSPSWSDSVFILTYDEGGGLYDHVPPPSAAQPDGIAPVDLLPTDPVVNFNRYGFRVPLLVVSPFTRPHYVSQTPMDHTAILKMIETRFNLPSLTARDAAQPDMSEFFDFDNVPWRTPPTPPDQPTDGPCYYDHLP